VAVTRAQVDQVAGLVLRRLAADREPASAEGDLTTQIVRILRRVLDARPQAQGACEALLNELYADRFGVSPTVSATERHRFMHWMRDGAQLPRAKCWEATDETVI
jgi:hypothetical protein